MSWVYFLRPIGMDGPIKIGCSVCPEERLTTFCSWSPFPLEIIARMPGNLTLEARLHAKFVAEHSHSEWFRASPELLALIEAVNDGTFEQDTLPAPRRLALGRRITPEGISASRYTRRLGALREAGVDMPVEVYKAQFTYRCSAEETDRRRAIVRAFVDGFGPFGAEARRAA